MNIQDAVNSLRQVAAYDASGALRVLSIDLGSALG